MAKFSPLMVLPPVIFGAFVLMAGIGMMRDDPNALPSTRKGQSAPPLQLSELPGKKIFGDADLRPGPGEVRLVNFWASWCAPCRAEHPKLMQLSKEGITIYGVNYKDPQDKALGFLNELGDPFAAIGADTTGRSAIDWGVYGVPETFVVDGNGTIVLRFAGPMTDKVIESTIRPAIEAAAKATVASE